MWTLQTIESRLLHCLSFTRRKEPSYYTNKLFWMIFFWSTAGYFLRSSLLILDFTTVVFSTIWLPAPLRPFYSLQWMFNKTRPRLIFTYFGLCLKAKYYRVSVYYQNGIKKHLCICLMWVLSFTRWVILQASCRKCGFEFFYISWAAILGTSRKMINV